MATLAALAADWPFDCAPRFLLLQLSEKNFTILQKNVMGVCFKRFRWAAIATALAALPTDWPFDCAEISNTQMKIFKTFQIAYFCGLKLNWLGSVCFKTLWWAAMAKTIIKAHRVYDTINYSTGVAFGNNFPHWKLLKTVQHIKSYKTHQMKVNWWGGWLVQWSTHVCF